MHTQKMTKSQAGKIGGETTKAKYGKEYYHQITQKGRAKLDLILEKGRQALAEEANQ